MEFWNNLRVVTTYRCKQGCKYCYAKGLLREYPRDMTLADFEKTVLWLKNPYNKKWLKDLSADSFLGKLKSLLPTDPFYRVALLGGEPTLHPDFIGQLELCRQHGVVPVVLSNTTYGQEVQDKLSRELVAAFLINYNLPEFYTPDRRERLESNIRQIHDKGIEFSFRYNILDAETPMDYVLDAAEKYGKKIKFSTINPGFSPDSEFIGLKQIRPVMRRVLEFVREAERRGVVVWLGRPIFPCMFTGEEWDYLVEKSDAISMCVLGKHGNNAYRTIVNPDLSTFLCFNVFEKGSSVLSFRDLGEISDYYAPRVDSLRWKALMTECEDCDKRLSKKCQAGCLSYKWCREQGASCI